VSSIMWIQTLRAKCQQEMYLKCPTSRGHTVGPRNPLVFYWDWEGWTWYMPPLKWL
jgi:hypothetical protein